MTSCSPMDRLLQTLRVQVPGATDAAISLALFNTIDEFLRRTSAWKFEQDIPLETGVQEYVLAPPIDSTIVRLMRISHNDVPVAAAASATAVASSLGRLSPEQTFPDGDATFAPVQTDLDASNLFTYAIYRPDWITITGIDPQTTQHPVKLVAALSIARSCIECDCGDWQLEEWMYDMYFQDWLDGALSRLFQMPAKPWSNKELMIYHGKRFRVAMGYRKQEAVRGFVWDVPTWRFPRGW